MAVRVQWIDAISREEKCVTDASKIIEYSNFLMIVSSAGAMSVPLDTDLFIFGRKEDAV